MPLDRRPAPYRRVFVVGVMLGLLLTACGNAGDDDASSPTTTSRAGGEPTVEISGVPGVTDDEIRFAALSTKANNPLGTCILDCFVDGIEAYFDYRNSEGGVHGRKLVLSKIVDDELGQNQPKALEVISANDTFATISYPLLATGFAEFAKERIPLYGTYVQSPERNGHETIFGNREVLCAACPQRWYPYVAKLAKATKVGILAYGVADIAKQAAAGLRRSFEKYGDDIGGAEVVYFKDDLPFGIPNGVGPEVTAMKREGVDLIFPAMDLNAVKTLAQELQRQGVRNDVTILNANLYDQKFVKEAGELFDGDFIIPIFRPFEANPGGSALGQYLEWMEKSGSELTENAMVGWINADLAYQGIKAAGPQFDREKVIAATNEFTDYTADGLTQPIDWTRQHDAPTPDDLLTNGPEFDCFPLVRVKDGEFEVVGERSKPWLCWPGDTTEWSEPTSMDFE
jgi:branched-chain amino acid transport system substrate-binding protein